MVKAQRFYVKQGHAGCSSPDPRSLPLPCTKKKKNKEKAGKEHKRGKHSLHKALKKIKEDAELGHLKNGSGEYISKTSAHSLSEMVDNNSNICYQNFQETRESRRLKKSDTSSGINLPAAVSLMDYDTSCESEISSSASAPKSFFPEIFRGISLHTAVSLVDYDDTSCESEISDSASDLKSFFPEIFFGINLPVAVSLVDYDNTLSESGSKISGFGSALKSFFPEIFQKKTQQQFINKNSTLLETSRAMDIDLLPEPENVSVICKHVFETDQLGPVESGKITKSDDHPVKPHLSTSVSGKQVHRVTTNEENMPTHNRESYFISPGRLHQKDSNNGKPICCTVTAPEMCRLPPRDKVHKGKKVCRGTSTRGNIPRRSILPRKLEQKFTGDGKPICCIITAPECAQISSEKEKTQQQFINKNSTLLETSRAMDIDLLPEPENVSVICKHVFETDQLGPVESAKSAQSDDHPVKPHLSTSVSGKQVYRVTTNEENMSTHNRESYVISPGRLHRKDSNNGKPICCTVTAPEVWRLPPRDKVHRGKKVCRVTSTRGNILRRSIFPRQLEQKFTVDGKPMCCIITAPQCTQISSEKDSILT